MMMMMCMLVKKINLKTQLGKLVRLSTLCFSSKKISVRLNVKNESHALHVDVGSWLCTFEVGCMDFEAKINKIYIAGFRRNNLDSLLKTGL